MMNPIKVNNIKNSRTLLLVLVLFFPLITNANYAYYYLHNNSKETLYIDNNLSTTCLKGGPHHSAHRPGTTMKGSIYIKRGFFTSCSFHHAKFSVDFSFDDGRRYTLWYVSSANTLNKPTKYVPNNALKTNMIRGRKNSGYLLATTAPKSVVTLKDVSRTKIDIDFNQTTPKNTFTIKICSDLSSKTYASEPAYLQSFIPSDRNVNKVKGYYFYPFSFAPNAGKCEMYSFNISTNDLQGKYVHFGIANPSVRIKQRNLPARSISWTDIGKIKFDINKLSGCYVNLNYNVSESGKAIGKMALVCH